MSKLTNRSQLTLKKIKAQYGDFINDSMYYLQKQKPELFPQENQQVQEEGSFLDALPVIGSIGQVIGGIAGIFEGAKKRKKQRIYENAYREDLQDKREKSRANNFYLTPYTAGRTDDLTAKKGMKVPLYQGGGQTDLNSFMEFYNQQEQAKQRQMVWLNSLYKDQNEQLKANAKQTTNQGISDVGGGLMGLAGSIFQQGGTIKTKYEDRQVTPAKINYGVSPIPAAQIRAIDSGGESINSLFRNFGKGNNKSKSKPRFREKQEGGEIEQPDTENLYSPDFNLDLNQVEEQVTNTLKAESPGESMLDNSNLMKWLFEEEPLQTHTVSDIYDQQYSNVKYVGEVPQKGDIATTHDNPGNIKYGKFAEKYGAVPGRQAKDGGVFAKFPSVEAGLQAQKDLLTSGSYANLSVSDAMKRWSNSGYGADLYPEIANKRMKDLNAQELNELILRQTKRESPTIYKKIYNK